MNGGLKWTLVLVAVAGLVGIIVYLNQIEPPDENPQAELTRAQLQQIVELRNVGVAQLENHQWKSATETFQELLSMIPESQLASKNLAIAQAEFYINLSATDPQTTASALNAATQSIQQLLEIAPDDSDAYRLRARILEKQLEFDAAIAELQKAAELSADDPAIWYEIYEASLAAHGADAKAIGLHAIQQAHRVAPENVFALLRWMTTMLDQAEPQLEQVVTDVQELLEPLADGVERRRRVDVSQLIQQAATAVESGNPDAAVTPLKFLFNVVNPDELNQADKRQLDVNSLEFVRFQFEEAIQQQIDQQLESAPPVTNVSFVQQPVSGDLPANVLRVEMADMNLDGRSDLILLTEGELRLCDRSDDEQSWVQTGHLQFTEPFTGFSLVDLDYDRRDADVETSDRYTVDLDLVLYGPSGVAVYETKLDTLGGAIEFERRSTEAALESLSAVTVVVPGDLNNDGDLDLAVVANGALQYWNNVGEFQFERVALHVEFPGRVVDCFVLDLDRDIDIDIVVLLEDGRLGVLESYRHGTFRWKDSGQVVPLANPRSMDIADLNRDGAWDVIVGGEGGVAIVPTKIPTVRKVEFQTPRVVSSQPAREVTTLDFDNNGSVDVLAADENRIALLSGDGQGQLHGLENVFPNDIKLNGAHAVFDIDEDGDVDLVLGGASMALLQNEGGNLHHWIDLAIKAAHVEQEGGVNSQRVNYYGLGSVVEVRAGAEIQQATVTSSSVRFGLGERAQADAIRIVWPIGIPQNEIQPQANQVVWEEQKLTGSCPYLYAWNGERFEFVTDLLWAAPIGLTSPGGELVPTRDWEYIKIPGDALQPQGDKYVLQVTEELWETAYFDQIELIAIDHPEEVAVYSNEKVGPPQIAEYQLHQVRTPRIPKSVVNQNGVDLLELVRDRDHRYARPFTHKILQGYTDDSFLEIDFGLTEKPDSLTLFLTGWVRPTDTGLNVALHENPALPGPTPPSIWAPNAAGEFVEVIPYCGFPGGKTKTIAIDLSDAFPANDYRIRFQTSLELYWDQIFFSTDSLEPQYRQQPLTCLSADLHERGVSEIRYSRPHAPEQFVYDSVLSIAAWPAIEGHFTRFGDVLGLVTEVDHQLVVMGAGDEMTLEFSLPDEPLPAGWKRDFILHCMGWDKDANLHTIDGQTVGPLPFVGMPGYPYDAQTTAPHPPESLQQFQTRRMDRDAFRLDFRRMPLEKLEPTTRTLSN